jgi:hypothetical protein
MPRARTESASSASSVSSKCLRGWFGLRWIKPIGINREPARGGSTAPASLTDTACPGADAIAGPAAGNGVIDAPAGSTLEDSAPGIGVALPTGVGVKLGPPEGDAVGATVTGVNATLGDGEPDGPLGSGIIASPSSEARPRPSPRGRNGSDMRLFLLRCAAVQVRLKPL